MKGSDRMRRCTVGLFPAHPFSSTRHVLFRAIKRTDMPAQPRSDSRRGASSDEGIANHIVVPGVEIDKTTRQLLGERCWMVRVVGAATHYPGATSLAGARRVGLHFGVNSVCAGG
jgi:hypothetical protein